MVEVGVLDSLGVLNWFNLGESYYSPSGGLGLVAVSPTRLQFLVVYSILRSYLR